MNTNTHARAERAAAIIGRIIGIGIRIGLYIAAAALTYKAITVAVQIAASRIGMPGGEILTIPFILALFLAGWTFRGDIERDRRKRRKRRRERRAAANGRIK